MSDRRFDRRFDRLNRWTAESERRVAELRQREEVRAAAAAFVAQLAAAAFEAAGVVGADVLVALATDSAASAARDYMER